MINNTITEYLTNELQNEIVTHAIFTTYNFEPDFFETEVIPLLFKEQRYYSNHPSIKRFQVQQELIKSKINIALFYDKNIFSSNETPQMEYIHQAVNHPNGAFHPKIIFILMEDKLLLYAGSNNITKAGWWDNIETGNYILIDSKHGINETTHLNIMKTLGYLKSQYSFELKDNSSFIAIEDFLNTNVRIINNQEVKFYFQSNKTDNCKSFFEQYLSSKLTHVEIISPYFPDDDMRNLENEVFPKRYTINMFLPKNQQDKAMCTREYYEFCKKNNIIWSKFVSNIEKDLVIKKDKDGNLPPYRKLHAKIFHFYNQQVSYFLTGSFNFTYKALYDNIEAGFLYKAINHHNQLLEVREGEEVFEENLFDEENPISLENEDIDIDILFDWKDKILIISTSDITALNGMALKDNNGDELQVINIKDKYTYIKDISAKLLSYMEKNSYLHIASQSVLIQHINWQYKPFSFGQMSISDILNIYSNLNLVDKESQYIAHMLAQLEKAGALYESSMSDIDVLKRDFFSEYSEIFYSFRMLKKLLIEAKDNNQNEVLEYYFRMEYPDSFSSVIKKIKQENKLDIATQYIVILSIEEIYNDVFKHINHYKDAPEFEKLKSLKESIKEIIGKEFPEQNKFLVWFEKEFLYGPKLKGHNND